MSTAYYYHESFDSDSVPDFQLPVVASPLVTSATGDVTKILLLEAILPQGIDTSVEFITDYSGYIGLNGAAATYIFGMELSIKIDFDGVEGELIIEHDYVNLVYTPSYIVIPLNVFDYRDKLYGRVFNLADGTTRNLEKTVLSIPVTICVSLIFDTRSSVDTAVRLSRDITNINMPEGQLAFYQFSEATLAIGVDLTDFLRQYGQIGENSEEYNGVMYWSENQIKNVVDGFREANTFSLTKLNKGLWKIDTPNWYWVDINTLDFQNSSGNSVAVSPLINHSDNTVRVASDVTLSQVFGLWVNVYDVLAELWNIRAAQRYDYIQMKAGANTLRFQNEYQHCIEQRDYYKNKVVRSFKR